MLPLKTPILLALLQIHICQCVEELMDLSRNLYPFSLSIPVTSHNSTPGSKLVTAQTRIISITGTVHKTHPHVSIWHLLIFSIFLQKYLFWWALYIIQCNSWYIQVPNEICIFFINNYYMCLKMNWDSIMQFQIELSLTS